jgi:hypothetical protein
MMSNNASKQNFQDHQNEECLVEVIQFNFYFPASQQV